MHGFGLDAQIVGVEHVAVLVVQRGLEVHVAFGGAADAVGADGERSLLAGGVRLLVGDLDGLVQQQRDAGVRLIGDRRIRLHLHVAATGHAAADLHGVVELLVEAHDAFAHIRGDVRGVNHPRLGGFAVIRVHRFTHVALLGNLHVEPVTARLPLLPAEIGGQEVRAVDGGLQRRGERLLDLLVHGFVRRVAVPVQDDLAGDGLLPVAVAAQVDGVVHRAGVARMIERVRGDRAHIKGIGRLHLELNGPIPVLRVLISHEQRLADGIHTQGTNARIGNSSLYVAVIGCRPCNVLLLRLGNARIRVGAGRVEHGWAVKRDRVLHTCHILLIGVHDAGVDGALELAFRVLIGGIDVGRRVVVGVVPHLVGLGGDGIDVRPFQTGSHHLIEMGVGPVQMRVQGVGDSSLREVGTVAHILVHHVRGDLGVRVGDLLPCAGVVQGITG